MNNKKGIRGTFCSIFILAALGILAGISGCQVKQQGEPGKWEPGVSQFSNNEITYSVVKQFLDEDTALTLVTGDQGVSIAIAHISSGITNFTYIPHDGGEISRREVHDLPLEEIYREAMDDANLPISK